MDILSLLMGKAAGGGGSGGSSWELVGSKEFEVSTTSTSQSDIGTIDLDVDAFNTGDILWVHLRDKAGKRTGYFYGHDDMVVLPSGVAYSNSQVARQLSFCTDVGVYTVTSGSYGVYLSSVSPLNKKVTISSKYSSSYGTINGTYKVDVYKLTPPFTMFE